MDLWQMITASIVGLISIILFVYSYFTSKEKGPILSNTYLFASDEERKKIDKSAEYHLVTIVFRILGTVFLLLTIQILTSWSWLKYIIGILVIVVIIYAIKESLKQK
jgi:hypothetical protein